MPSVLDQVRVVLYEPQKPVNIAGTVRAIGTAQAGLDWNLDLFGRQKAAIAQAGVTVEKILLTHGHIDHAGEAKALATTACAHSMSSRL